VSARTPAVLRALPNRVLHLDAARERREPDGARSVRPRPRGGDGQGGAAWRRVAEPAPGA
jgi:hypothetical protein